MARTMMLLLAALAIGIAGPSAARAQSAKDLVGTWLLVSGITEKDDKKFETFGPGAKGTLFFDATGRFSIVFIAAGLPKFASNNRSQGTADENKAIVGGSIAQFGTYVVNEADKSFTFRVERSTFPNREGMEQRLAFTVSADDLMFTDPHSSAGGATTVTWKRAK
jgi:lipocalin-like protein